MEEIGVKVVLICPANMFLMPYVECYRKILTQNKINYDIINWDRLHIEDVNTDYKYRDKKVGHRRSYLDYYKYMTFVQKRLKKFEYDKIIIFGIQLSYFLKRYIISNYKGKYIIDIRDHNKIVNYFNISRIIENSDFTVISSPMYKQWLPKGDKYVINHNTQISSLIDLKKTNINTNKKIYCISNIGAIRDYDINKKLIDSLKNNENIELCFHGESETNMKINEYVTSNNIQNVIITGKYSQDEEENLYNKSDLINILVANNEINSKTLLPNRLYNAVLYGKPIITNSGTYIAEVVKKYNLGIVLSSFDDIERNILNYMKGNVLDLYENGRELFVQNVIKDNKEFREKLEKFLS